MTEQTRSIAIPGYIDAAEIAVAVNLKETVIINIARSRGFVCVSVGGVTMVKSENVQEVLTVFLDYKITQSINRKKKLAINRQRAKAYTKLGAYIALNNPELLVNIIPELVSMGELSLADAGLIKSVSPRVKDFSTVEKKSSKLFTPGEGGTT